MPEYKIIDAHCETAGLDHLGIGADFDGIEEVIEGLEDVTALPRLVDGLFNRGFSREEIDKITHKNFIRVLEKVLPPAIIHDQLIKKGFIVSLRRGHNSLRIDPPLIIEKEHLADFTAGLDEVLSCKAAI